MPRHYPYLLDTTMYPDYERRQFEVPSWKTFDGKTQFTALRDLSQTAWREDLDRYTKEFRLGNVIWPLVQLLYVPHFAQVVEEIKKRKLYLFDMWSIVPGSPMEGIWSNITPPPGVVAHLRRTLGERFLGIDNGEQDGRYVWATGQQQCPSLDSREAQYLMFQKHFQKLADEAGNQVTALVSLCFGHYFIKEGNHILLGAETAQALPCSQIYYAFIRGACRQYGIHWFGNASVFNRWGWKDYGPEQKDGSYRSGPDMGTSLSLLKRLMYSHYLYNCVALGFESGWLQPKKRPAGNAGNLTTGGHVVYSGPMEYELTPIGRIQAAAARFVEQQGQPGVMHAPVALLLDFFAGWAPPRHLYTGYVYQVWGGMPYAAGDYLAHGVLGLLYPGYEDASYYHDERGFLTPTPFGDMAECLLSDVPEWILAQYGLVVVSGALRVTIELKRKLVHYVEAGGKLVLTGENARSLFPDLGIGAVPAELPAGSVVSWSANGEQDTEAAAFELLPATLPPGAEVLAGCAGKHAVVRLRRGSGSITVALCPFGLPAASVVDPGPVENAQDKPLPCPFPLLAHVSRLLRSALAEERLFSVGAGLGYVTCRKGAGSYTVGVFNNGLKARPFAISSHCGSIRSVRELALDHSEKGAVGYWPTGFDRNDGGQGGAGSIAGGDVRLFAVEVEEREVALVGRPVGLSAPGSWFVRSSPEVDIQEAILRSPTFFQHYRGVSVDWRYFLRRDRAELERERGWIERQRVRIIVDFSNGLNLYPTLSLLDAYTAHFEESVRRIDEVMDKMLLLPAREMVITLHRKPENHWSDDRARAEFVKQVGELCARARLRGLTVHLQAHRDRWVHTTAEAAAFVREVGAANLRVAVNTGHALMVGEEPAAAVAAAGDRLGAVLFCAAERDQFGQWYDAHLPLAGRKLKLSAYRELARRNDVALILDGSYAGLDEAYADLIEAGGK